MKNSVEWDDVTKNLSKKEIEEIGGELGCLMAAEVRKEIDACIIEEMKTGNRVRGIEPMNIPNTPEWRRWSKNQKKMGDIGEKLLKKYESKNKKTKR